MKLTSPMLRELFASIYPPGGGMPTNAEALHWRTNEDARHQLLFSLLIQFVEQSEKDSIRLMLAIKKELSELTAAPAEAAPAADIPPGEDPNVEVMPMTQAVSNRPMPHPTSTVGPQNNAPVTMSAFTPANVTLQQPPSS